MRQKIVAATICAFAMSALGAGSAFGGEITDNGKPLWTNTDQWDAPHTLHGQSACAFSGQEDDQYGAGLNPDYNPDAFHAQSWGRSPATRTVPWAVFRGPNATPLAQPAASSY